MLLSPEKPTASAWKLPIGYAVEQCLPVTCRRSRPRGELREDWVLPFEVARLIDSFIPKQSGPHRRWRGLLACAQF